MNEDLSCVDIFYHSFFFNFQYVFFSYATTKTIIQLVIYTERLIEILRLFEIIKC